MIQTDGMRKKYGLLDENIRNIFPERGTELTYHVHVVKHPWLHVEPVILRRRSKIILLYISDDVHRSVFAAKIIISKVVFKF